MASTSSAATSIPSSELAAFNQYYTEWVGPSTTNADSIPRFFDKVPKETDHLRQRLREEARSLFLQRKSLELLDNEELRKILALLEQNVTPPVVDDEKMIGYQEFRIVSQAVSTKAKSFFTAAVFAKLQQQDPYGRISILHLFNYIMRKTWLRQSRIGLSLYDMTGLGYLTEKDLELYIVELIPTLSQLEKLEESFQSFYVCTAVRRFMFMLDPLRQGKVRIVDILASGFLDDLLELRDEANEQVSSRAKPNWFSIESATKIYAQYLNLDTDRNGMLSKVELGKYGTGTLTDAFLDRVFQECLTYEGELDYKSYLDFVLAMENKKDPSALQYFFRLLDVRHRGYLDAFALNFFFRSIQRMLDESEQQPVLFEDVKDEIFDMVKPRDPLRIKLQDLIDSLQGDTVVNILTDLNGFMTYENREVLATEPADDEDQEEPV